MGKLKPFLINLILSAGSFSAASELPALIRCHEALDGKSEGKSEKLTTTAATPFMIASGKNLYFVTDSSIGVLENKFAGRDLIVRLEEKQGPVFAKMSFQKNGALANLGFQELSKDEKLTAVTPRAQLDEESLNIVKNDLVKRMNSVTGEYQNKYDPQGTIEALNRCSDVKSETLQKSLAKQLPFYQTRARKKSGAYKTPSTN